MNKPELEGQLHSFPEKSHTVQGSPRAHVYELALLVFLMHQPPPTLYYWPLRTSLTATGRFRKPSCHHSLLLLTIIFKEYSRACKK